MRFILFLCFFVLISPTLFSGEDEPVKKRPRIRVYDQKANLVPVTRPDEERRAEQLELDRKLRNEVRVSDSSFGPVNFQPIVPLNTGVRETNSESAEEEEKWITAKDFLLDEDRMNQDDLQLSVEKESDNNQEIEITDWESLQNSMIEDTLKKKRPEMSDQELEELISDKEAGDSESVKPGGGLEMEDIAPLQDLNQQPPDRMGENSLPASLRDVGGFAPVLQSARQMNGEVHRPVRDRDPRLELSGSREMLNGIKEKWAKPSEGMMSRDSSSFELPGASRIQSGGPRPQPLENPFPGSLAANPAIRFVPAAQTEIREPSVQVQRPSTPTRRNPAPGPQNDYRLRSKLGSPSGF